MDGTTYMPSCICGQPGPRCLCGCVVPEAAPEAVVAGRCARTASTSEVLPPAAESIADASATAAPAPKSLARILYSSRFELQRSELAPIDSEAQLLAAISMERARLRKRSKWRPPSPDDLDDEELELVGTVCEISLTSELVASAAAGADSRALCCLVREYNLDPNAQDMRTGQTALQAAAAHGHTETVAGLVELGVNVSDVDPDGRCALWLACARGHPNVLALLLDLGPEIAPPLDDGGKSCAGQALRLGHDGSLVALLNRATGADGGAGVAAARELLGQISQDDAAEAATLGHFDALRALRRYEQGSWGAEAPPAPLVGQRVVLHGLQGRPELNQRTGVVTAWDAATDRYSVTLDASSSGPAPDGPVCVSGQRLVLEADAGLADGDTVGVADEGKEGPTDDGYLGQLARGSCIFRDAAGLPRCDEYGYDPYGNPIWNAFPRWLVEDVSTAPPHQEHLPEQGEAVGAPATGQAGSSSAVGDACAHPSPSPSRSDPGTNRSPAALRAVARPACIGHNAPVEPDTSMDAFTRPDTSIDVSIEPELARLAAARHAAAPAGRGATRRAAAPPQPSPVTASSGSEGGSDIAVTGRSEGGRDMAVPGRREGGRDIAVPGGVLRPCARGTTASARSGASRSGASEPVPSPEPRKRRAGGGAAASEAEESAQSAEEWESPTPALNVRCVRPRGA